MYLEAAQLIRRQYKGWIHLQQKLLYIAVEFDRWRFSLRLSLKTNIANGWTLRLFAYVAVNLPKIYRRWPVCLGTRCKGWFSMKVSVHSVPVYSFVYRSWIKKSHSKGCNKLSFIFELSRTFYKIILLRNTNRINNLCVADTSLHLNIFTTLNEPYPKSILKGSVFTLWSSVPSGVDRIDDNSW